MSYHGLGFMGNVQESAYKAFVSAGKMPPGLSPEYLSSYPVTSNTYRSPVGSSGVVAEQCNKSAQPSICYYAKSNIKPDGNTPAFLGRASKQSDWAAWRDWSPPGEAALDQTSGEVEVAGGVSDVVFYGGIAAALALVGLGVWYSTK